MHEGAAAEEALKLYAFACKAARGEPLGLKFNPNHDEQGRFAEGAGGSAPDRGDGSGAGGTSPGGESPKVVAGEWKNPAHKLASQISGVTPDVKVTSKTLYHITKHDNAEKILNSGFDLSKVTPRYVNDYAVSLSVGQKHAEEYFTGGSGKFNAEKYTVLAVKIKGRYTNDERPVTQALSARDYNKQIIAKGLDGENKGDSYLVHNVKSIVSIQAVDPLSAAKGYAGTKRTSATDYVEKLKEEFGIDIDDLGFDTEPPQWFLEAAFNRLEETFSLDYWQGINDTTLGNIESAISRGIEGGLSMREIADGIMDEGEEFSKSRAMNIARTEVGGALNAGHEDGIRQIGEETGLAATKVWTSILGPTTRDTHAEADGQEVPVDDPFIVGGEEAMFPGDPELSAAERCQCQCTLISGISADELGDIDAEPLDDSQDDNDKGFDPSEPRDEHGEWTDGGGAATSGTDSASQAAPAQQAAPRKLAGAREAAEFAEKHFPAGDKFSPEEVAALDKYSDTGSTRINEGLRRNGGDISKVQAKKAVAALDSAVKKGTVPEDVVAYRGIGSGRLFKLKVGDTLKDDGFVSTTLYRPVAQKFGKLSHSLMEIKVPKGSHGLAFDAIWNGGNRDEHELMLPRGASFKVTGVRESKGTRVVEAEYVP